MVTCRKIKPHRVACLVASEKLCHPEFVEGSAPERSSQFAWKNAYKKACHPEFVDGPAPPNKATP
jgi:hypothetical protein